MAPYHISLLSEPLSKKENCMPSHMPSVIDTSDGLRHGSQPLVSPSSWYHLRIWAAQMLDQCQSENQAFKLSEADHIPYPVILDHNSPIWKQQPDTSLLLSSSYLSGLFHLESSPQGVEDCRNDCLSSVFPISKPPFNVILQVLHHPYWSRNLTWLTEQGRSRNVQLSS